MAFGQILTFRLFTKTNKIHLSEQNKNIFFYVTIRVQLTSYLIGAARGTLFNVWFSVWIRLLANLNKYLIQLISDLVL